jgi:uncharacterized Zn-binding protein involved in type VI secretion
MVTSNPNVTVNGIGVIVIGDLVVETWRGSDAIMITGSPTVFVNGRQLCRTGDLDNLGDSAIASTTNVFAG